MPRAVTIDRSRSMALRPEGAGDERWGSGKGTGGTWEENIQEGMAEVTGKAGDVIGEERDHAAADQPTRRTVAMHPGKAR